MGVGGQRHAPAALPPGKTRYPLYKRLGWLQSQSGWVWKISPPLGFDPQTVEPVACHYTDCAIPARTLVNITFTFCHWSASIAVMQYDQLQQTLVSFQVFMAGFAQMMVCNVITQHKRVVIFCPFRGVCCHPEDGGKMLLWNGRINPLHYMVYKPRIS